VEVLSVCRISIKFGVARMGEMRNSYNILVGKCEGSKPLGRPRWDDDFKMDRKKVSWEGVGWMHLVPG